MALLATAVVAFALVHLVSAVPPAKAPLQARLGRAYGPVFGSAVTAALILIVLGWRAAGYVPVYEPPAWGRQVTFLLVFAAFLGLGVFLFRGRLRQRLRFPMAISVMLWAGGHLIVNGDLRSIILFGGLLVYGAAHLGLGLAYGVKPAPQVRPGHDMLSLIAGVALYAVVVQLHGVLFGMPALAL